MSFELRDRQGRTPKGSGNEELNNRQKWFTSDKPKDPPIRWYPGKPEPSKSPRAGERLHDHDAEIKAVHALTEDIVLAWPAAAVEDQGAWSRIAEGFSGNVWLGCSQGPCHSCRWVIRQISKDMPNVTFYVTYPAKDVNRPVTQKEGTAVSLYGEYGYQMAHLSETKSVWAVTVIAGKEAGYDIPRNYPADPPGGEPVDTMDESRLS
jgi:hypothetical protein